MIIAGLVLITLSLIYGAYIYKKFRRNELKFLSKTQYIDTLGNILIIVFFSFLGVMFIYNNLK